MKYLFSIVIIFFCIELQAQQDFLLTNFSSNSLFINPAIAGSSGYKQGTLFFNYRDQWMGLDGSPRTMMVGGEYNLFNDRIGLGGSISRESIGIDNRFDFLSNVAYRLPLQRDNEYLSFGLRVAAHFFSSELTAIRYTDSQDLIYDGQNDQFSVFSVGTGVYYTIKNSYIGLSVPSIVAVSKSTALFRTRHFYLNAGSKLYFNDYNDFALEPAVLLKYEFAAPIQYSLGAKLWLVSQFGVGALYRSGDGFAVSCHVNLNDSLDLGTSYDFNTSELNQGNIGSVEIFVGYKINNDDADPFR